jgi:hypothetical protein
MTTGDVPFNYLSGEKLYQVRARAALPLLVRQATQAHSATIFYSDLAAELGMSNERNLNYVLGYIGDALEELSKRWKEDIPPIQCLVINKRDRLPGEGIGWFITKKEEFRKLPRREQRRLVDLELQKVLHYRKWPAVLTALGLSPATMNLSKVLSQAETLGPTRETRGSAFGSGGESPEHKRLKTFMAQHPEKVGLPAAVGPGDIEKALRSGDILDVFFGHGQDHIAVEVKSALSNDADIVRGMFQCVKYRSVLEAQQAVDGLPQSARAILVLEAKLPASLRSISNVLGIEIVDEVIPAR